MSHAEFEKQSRLWLICVIGVLVPQRLRTNWRQEWEAELQWREQQLAEWNKLNWKNKLDLLWHSAGAFVDALWLLPKRWEDEMMQDIRFGARMLRKHKWLTLVAALSLGLGIGTTSVMYALTDQLLLHNVTAHEPERLVGFNHGPWSSYPNFQDIRASKVFADLTAGVQCYPEPRWRAGEQTYAINT